MGGHWLVIVLFAFLIEHIRLEPSSESLEYPLTKSLGYSMTKLGKGPDSRISQEFMEKYHEMRKASLESFENFEMVKEETRRRRVIGDDELEEMKEGRQSSLPLLGNDPPFRRRISANKLQSVVGRRRARSQALRREKLNSQSLRSHMHYSKQSNMEYVND